MLLMIDNYDSFTYNLVQYLGELGADVHVHRNDAITLEQIAAWEPDADRHLARALHAQRGGHLGAADPALRRQDSDPRRLPRPPGDRPGVRRAGSSARERVMHGKVSPVAHDGRGVFAGLPSPLTATRYHSLAIERASLPACLEVTATADDGEIMGVRHREWPVEGVQFHPEAILTEHGHALLRNFLEGARSAGENEHRPEETP